MKRFLIIDGNSIMNRAFYGIRLLTNKDGVFTNAVYGFLNIFFKNLDAINPDYVAVAFDLKAPTFRHLKYAQYKAQRKGMPDELFAQMPVIKEVLNAMNITVLEKEGYEADDVIGTVSNFCDKQGIECYILTGDKDDLQLATKTTKVCLTITSKGNTTTDIYTEEDVYRKYGVTPSEFIDVKGLMGDPSDNIPGVKGIGEKTAFALIQKYKSIEEVYNNLDNLEVGPSAKAKLADGREMAFFSKELATIDINTPIEESVEDCAVKEYNYKDLKELFLRLEFKTFLKRLPVEKVEQKKAELQKNVFIIDEEKALKGALEGISSFEYCLFAEDGKYSAIAFTGFDKNIIYTELPIALFKDIFEDISIKKTGHDIKTDIVLLNKEGINYGGLGFDTFIAAYLLDSSSTDYSLNALAQKYLEQVITDIDGLLGKGKNRQSFKDLPNKTYILAEELNVIIALEEILLKRLEENNQAALLYDMELPLIEVLAHMQIEGFKVDPLMLKNFSEELGIRTEGLYDSITFMAGEEFNINSPKQMGVILFEKLGLPIVKKTKTGYSTDVEVLEKLKGRHEIIDAILEYRQLIKLKSTYADGLIGLINEKTGKIHSTFNQTVTTTGRISSTEPNMQNIPVRLSEGRKIRKMFTADDNDHILVDADYSQIELRVLAHMSGDENMIRSFKEGVDIHRRTAAQVFGVGEDQVTPIMRQSAKAVNFGIVYGISDFGLAQDIGVSRYEAKKYIEAYFATYPKVKEFMESMVEEAKKNGYVTTIFGRRRYIPELSSKNYNLRSFGERAAMNTPVQGSAADIIKIAMVRASKALTNETKESKLILQVHDELIVHASIEEREITEKILTREMENACVLSVPLEAEAKSGFSWYDAK
ncbi:MAG: DNA polymerase I [Bacillota bacterium]|nr:DNA polymerase I [Bacillota bacterium]